MSMSLRCRDSDLPVLLPSYGTYLPVLREPDALERLAERDPEAAASVVRDIGRIRNRLKAQHNALQAAIRQIDNAAAVFMQLTPPPGTRSVTIETDVRADIPGTSGRSLFCSWGPDYARIVGRTSIRFGT